MKIIFTALLLFNVLSFAEWQKNVMETFREHKNTALEVQLQTASDL